MRVLFVGYILHKNDVIKYKGASAAGNHLQLNYIKYLHQAGINIDILSFVPIAFFPKSKKLLIKSKISKIDDELSASFKGFINLPLLKSWIQTVRTKHFIKSWIKRYPDENKSIIVYNSNPEIAQPVVQLSSYPLTKTFCILADPPIESIKQSSIISYFKHKQFHQSKKIIPLFNALIVLNQNSAKHYAPQLRYHILEGGIDVDLIHNKTLRNPSILKRVIYAGALTNYSGVKELLDAIPLVGQQDFEVVFYGEGPLKSMILEHEKSSHQVIYGGYITRDQLIKQYQEASFLINPRLINDQLSQLSFPSKLFEYLLSEVPVITSIFDGMPKEYVDHVNPLHFANAKELALEIKQILSQDYQELQNKAKRAKSWVISEKNWSKQMSSLIQFINAVHDHKEE